MAFQLYDDNGYVNIKAMLKLGLPFIYVIGPRGTGKTYTALKEAIDLNEPFIYMRRMQVQLDECATPFGNPFKKLNSDLNYTIEPKAISKNSYGFYQTTVGLNSKGNPTTEYNEEICTALALSTFANLRGFDGSDYNLIIFDEIIAQPEQKAIKEEDKAFLNAYETINRNREDYGQKPVQCLLLGNADRLDAPMLNAFGVIPILERMIRNDQEVYINTDRGIGIFYLSHSPISKKKANSALYKAISEESDFYRMAINNAFVDFEESRDIRSMPLKEFVCIAAVGDLGIYFHKAANVAYVCKHISGTPDIYLYNKSDIKRFRNAYDFIFKAWLRKDIVYDSYDTKYKFENIYH